MFYYNDPTILLLIPAVIFSLWAEWKVKAVFEKYSKVRILREIDAQDAISEILKFNGIHDVKVKYVNGILTDYYDPVNKILALSEKVYGHSSIAALCVAAHEAGHAIQHYKGYSLIQIRNSFIPLVNITSNLSMPLFFMGLIMGIPVIVKLGILLFCGVVLFHIITLPVELDASNRALAILKSRSYLTPSELVGAREVLNAAAMTYLSAAIMSLVNLLRLIIIARSSED